MLYAVDTHVVNHLKGDYIGIHAIYRHNDNERNSTFSIRIPDIVNIMSDENLTTERTRATTAIWTDLVPLDYSGLNKNKIPS